jgi:hypothetical protein
MLCATFQVFKSQVLKWNKTSTFKLVSTSLNLLRVILHFVSHYMFQPVAHHQVLLLSGNCCTFFALFLYLIINVQSSAAHYVFLVSHVLALCIAVTVKTLDLKTLKVAQNKAQARRE